MKIHQPPHEKPLRPVRSYVLRQGRITPAQQQALTQYWPTYGLDISNHPINIEKIFERNAPCILEIGFGMGQSLITQAQQQPENNFIGIEVHRPGVGSLLTQLHQNNINNVRVFCADAIEILQKMIPDNSLAKIQIFFPDPWPKKRHHKRRLIQTEFIALIAQKLAQDGILHIATDWQDYAESVLQLLNNSPLFTNTATDKKFVPRPTDRPLTKFEARGEKLGHGVWDVMFRRR